MCELPAADTFARNNTDQIGDIYLDPTPGTKVQEDSEAIIRMLKDIVDRVAKVLKE